MHMKKKLILNFHFCCGAWLDFSKQSPNRLILAKRAMAIFWSNVAEPNGQKEKFLNILSSSREFIL